MWQRYKREHEIPNVIKILVVRSALRNIEVASKCTEAETSTKFGRTPKNKILVRVLLHELPSIRFFCLNEKSQIPGKICELLLYKCIFVLQ